MTRLFFFSRVFFTDVLNFSFWAEDPTKKYTVRYNETDWTGYWSLCAALNRAIDVSDWATGHPVVPSFL